MGSLHDGSPSSNPDPDTDTDGQLLQTPNPEPVTKAPAINPDASDIVKSAVDRTLHFIGNASNETLGACLVGLGATTYLVLGRVGLILIGAVGGVVLHASWEGSGREQGEDARDREHKRKKEANSEIALRLMQWRESRTSREAGDDNELSEEKSNVTLDYSNFEPETGKALNVLTDAVIRDYVHWWYDPVRPNENIFPSTCRKTFTGFILALASNLSRKRSTDTFLEFVTNSSSIMIVVLNELSQALSASPALPPSDAVQAYLAAKPQSNLSNILDTEQQRRKLEMVANDILETYLDAKVFHCPPARVFLKETLANIVLETTIQSCSRSEWINEWIVYLLEDGEPELMNVIDAGVEESTAQRAIAPSSQPAVDYADPTQDSGAAAETRPDHKRHASKAEQEMDDAMREAQRLTQLIAEEDARRAKESSSAAFDDASDSTNTHGIETPGSSQSDSHVDEAQKSTTGTSNDPSSPIDDSNGNPANTNDSSALTGVNEIIPAETPIVSDVEIPEALTLHKANISIFDDASPNDRRALKSKPTIDYMVQIEPSSSNFRGWMIARTYTDFETLHEVLRRISTISGAVKFSEAHNQLPAWRGASKAQLTSELERYLTDALQYEPLAESEGMKRFLEKSLGVSKSPATKNVFWASGQAIENVGKGMFDVLSKAPKGMAGGGKAVLGGVTSVLGGGINAKRAAPSPTVSSSAVPSSPNHTRSSASLEIRDQNNPSLASLGTSSQPASPRSSTSTRDQVLHATESIPSRPATPVEPQMNLPPPPSEIKDDYKSLVKTSEPPESAPQSPGDAGAQTTPVASGSSPTFDATHEAAAPPEPPRTPRSSKKKTPISEQEAQVTVELLFAVINELYMLSSAWNIRRTLLNAAKAYLLRPGNVQLENIRSLLQESVLDANTSDAGMAAHILKLRENTLPTEEELKKWPPLPTEAEKEALRKRARKMLIERGMPQALTSVMGVAASGEALGRVFDCLQVAQVARGLVFGMMLQAVRAVTQ